ncbi:MAG: DUF3232 domain-containing protein [Anaerolineaceae bacterium]|jgi:hypothetical protein|nr:DUF3232 domain-containing protein [Anaerolineaceae bacterium]
MVLFNDKEYLKLEAMIKGQAAQKDQDAIEDLSFLKTAMLAFCEYAYKVNEEQIETRLAKGILTGEELREVIEHFDGTRHTAHERAIAQAKALNRMAIAYSCEQIYLGDESVRFEIGSFCGEVADWIFRNRT